MRERQGAEEGGGGARLLTVSCAAVSFELETL